MKNILEIIFWAFLTRTTKKFPSVLVPTFVGGGADITLLLPPSVQTKNKLCQAVSVTK